MALVLAGFAALLYGVADFSGGYAAVKARLLSVLLYSQLAGTAVAVAAAVAFSGGVPAWKDVGWGFVAGLTGSMGLFMLYGGIARSIVAIVSPTSAVVGAILPVLFGLLSGERPSSAAIAGSLLCLPAIVLLSWESGEADTHGSSVRTALGFGVLAGVGFGLFFTTLSFADKASGIWPLLGARLASVGSFLVALLIKRERPSVPRGARATTLLAGTADMGANILFLLAAQSGLLSLVAVVTSLFPAPTVVLARVFLGQRIPPVRIAGLALALLGVGLISAR